MHRKSSLRVYSTRESIQRQRGAGCSSVIKGLYCITNSVSKGTSYETIVESFCSGGADIVQFRAKELSASELIRIGKKLRQITRRYKVPLIVNDRLDVALLIAADGLHLGQDDLPVLEVKNFIASSLHR